MYSRRGMRLTLATIITVFAIMVTGAMAASVYHVDANVVSPGDGSDWDHAFETIQDGIDACNAGSSVDPDLVKVAGSTSGLTYDENIVLDSYITLEGGWDPGGAHDPETYVTTIDGGAAAAVVTIVSKNCVTIEGFTMTNGSATSGGGIYCYSSSPTLANCTVSDNTATSYGGGIYGYVNCSPTLTNCTVSDNMAYHGGGMAFRSNSLYYVEPIIEGCTITRNNADGYGAGIYCRDYCYPKLTDCTISENIAVNHGGGLYCGVSGGTAKDCTFSANRTGQNGGGIHCDWWGRAELTNSRITHNAAEGYGAGICMYWSGSRTLTNCLLTGNSAEGSGGAAYVYYHASAEFVNCTIAGNTAGSGAGGVETSNFSSADITNCILWGDTAGGVTKETYGSVNVNYSDVEGSGYGEDGGCTPDTDGNIDCDPQFRSRGGDTEVDGYFLDQEGSDKSPCIDTGDTSQNPYGGSSNCEYTTDVGGHLDMTGTGWDDEVDMGYHYPYGTYTYIELVSFTASPNRSSIVLAWETGAEIDNAGFLIYRALAGTFGYQQVSGLIAAEGSASLGASYSFTDSSVEPGVSYNYWLIDIETSGKWMAHGPVSARLPLHLDRLERPSYTANRQSAFAQGYGGQVRNCSIGEEQ